MKKNESVFLLFQPTEYIFRYLAYIPLSAVILITFVFLLIPMLVASQKISLDVTSSSFSSALLQFLGIQANTTATEKDILFAYSKIAFIFSCIALVFDYILKKSGKKLFKISKKTKFIIFFSVVTVLMVLSQVLVAPASDSGLILILVFFWILDVVCYGIHLVLSKVADSLSTFHSSTLTTR